MAREKGDYELGEERLGPKRKEIMAGEKGDWGQGEGRLEPRNSRKESVAWSGDIL